jgi:hypothetical protein
LTEVERNNMSQSFLIGQNYEKNILQTTVMWSFRITMSLISSFTHSLYLYLSVETLPLSSVLVILPKAPALYSYTYTLVGSMLGPLGQLGPPRSATAANLGEDTGGLSRHPPHSGRDSVWIHPSTAICNPAMLICAWSVSNIKFHFGHT